MRKSLVVFTILGLILSGCASNNKNTNPTMSIQNEKSNNSNNESSMSNNSKNISSKNILVQDSEIENNNQQNLEPELPKADKKRIRQKLKSICKTPRKVGTDENTKAALWLEKTLSSYNYDVNQQEFDVYRQDLSTFYSYDYDFLNLNPYNEKEAEYKTTNVIALKKASVNLDKTLIISAHYDTISNTKGVIDNGSGSATVLEIAEILKDYPLPFNVQFIFFGSEEHVLSGSRYYISQLSEEERENIIGCINIDMVGNTEPDETILNTIDGTENILTLNLLDNLNDTSILKTGFGFGMSDDYSFYKVNIPSILIMDSELEQFDKDRGLERDSTISSISVKRLEKITNEICNMVISLSINIDKFYNYKSDIDINKISDIYKTDKIIDNKIEGYELISVEQKLLESGLSSQITYLFENNNNESYQILQEHENFYKDLEYEDYLLVEEDENYKLIINDIVETQIIGNLEQIKKLAKIWDINL